MRYRTEYYRQTTEIPDCPIEIPDVGNPIVTWQWIRRSEPIAIRVTCQARRSRVPAGSNIVDKREVIICTRNKIVYCNNSNIKVLRLFFFVLPNGEYTGMQLLFVIYIYLFFALNYWEVLISFKTYWIFLKKGCRTLSNTNMNALGI